MHILTAVINREFELLWEIYTAISAKVDDGTNPNFPYSPFKSDQRKVITKQESGQWFSM